MGKALLIIVMGAGIVLARHALSGVETGMMSREDQLEYEEEVLAREIARSGFNVAMGIAREHPNSLDAAVAAIHNSDGTVDTRMRGDARGGEYVVRAETLTGHVLRITSTGYFGGHWATDDAGNPVYKDGGTYTMSDNYRIRVLEVKQDGMLDTAFLASVAGYCSSVFMEEWYDDSLVATRMIYPAGHNRNGATSASSFYVRAGTQLNFFIGVDQNCSEKLSSSTSTCEERTYMFEYDYDPSSSDWNYVHHALDVPEGAMSQADESIWALVEQHPGDRQRWRIAWEDIHNTSWDRPNGTNPRTSIQAFKIQGYDTDGDGVGNGWQNRDSYGYRALTEGGLDLNDQQIEVAIRPIRNEAARDSVWRVMRTERDACGITSNDGMPPEPDNVVCHNNETRVIKESALQAHLNHGDTQGECPPPPENEVMVCHDGNSVMVVESQLSVHLGHGDTQGACPAPPEPEPEEPEEEENEGLECPCSRQQLQSHKVGILHRPPGNPSNERRLCIARRGWERGHRPRHDDVLICER